MPGVHAWHSGDQWEFYKPILEGDTFTYTNELVDVLVKDSQMAGKTVIQYHDIKYYNQREELVAKAHDWCVRAARKAAEDKGKYADIKAAEYTKEELDKIYKDYESEIVRGATPRYWEDVVVGDALQPVIKGPLSAVIFMLGSSALAAPSSRRTVWPWDFSSGIRALIW